MKKLFPKAVPLYLLTDTRIAKLTNIQITRQALSSGIRVIQIRDKTLSKKDLYKEAITIRALTREHNALLIINDHIDIALAVEADGVHLGQEDMPLAEARKIIGRKMIIGISTHFLKQAQAAQRDGADYIGFGPVFNTGTKDAGKPKGLKALQKIKDHIDIPIVAIGGISSENIREVLMSGADTAAVASGILGGNIMKNTKKYLSSLE